MLGLAAGNQRSARWIGHTERSRSSSEHCITTHGPIRQDRRHPLDRVWADSIDAMRAGGNVVNIKRKA